MNYNVFVLVLILSLSIASAADIQGVEMKILPSDHRPEVIAGQHLGISINVSQQEVESTKIMVGQRLSIKVEEHNISDESAKRFAQANAQNYNIFEAIMKLTARIMEKPEDKEMFASELTEMDSDFVQRYCLVPTAPLVKEQAEDYVHTVQAGMPLKVTIEDSDVDNVFKKKTTLDSLMDSIWNSFDSN
ncbi:MAG: hypothetical protein ABIJ34_01265 [archaeon]